MDVGISKERSSLIRFAAAALGLGVVAIDLSLHHWERELAFSSRIPLSWLALVGLGALAGWNRQALGLRLSPIQGWRYWIKAVMVVAGAMLVMMAAAGMVLHLAGVDWYKSSSGWPLEAALRWFVSGCLEAPLYEETIYRLALCVGLVAVVGRWPTIVLSGLVFALLHFVYGNPGPDNVVAGFILGWAFLKSGSITVPIILHALGNFVVLVSQVILSASF